MFPSENNWNCKKKQTNIACIEFYTQMQGISIV